MKPCRVCKEGFTPQRTLQRVCSPKCALVLVNQKNTEKARKDFNAETRRSRARLKTYSKYVKEAQVEFNKYIRLRDFDKPCISCGICPEMAELHQGWKFGGAWDCGHYKPVGAFPELRFNEINAHRQCKSCNSGSYHHAKKSRTVSAEYRDNLIKRIGLPLVEWLDGPHSPLKATKDELAWLKIYYRDRAKEIIKHYEGMN